MYSSGSCRTASILAAGSLHIGRVFSASHRFRSRTPRSLQPGIYFRRIIVYFPGRVSPFLCSLVRISFSSRRFDVLISEVLCKELLSAIIITNVFIWIYLEYKSYLLPNCRHFVHHCSRCLSEDHLHQVPTRTCLGAEYSHIVLSFLISCFFFLVDQKTKKRLLIIIYTKSIIC